MSNKTIKNKKDTTINKKGININDELNKYPFLKKMYLYLDESAKQKSKKRSIINNIICSCVIALAIFNIGIKNNCMILFGTAHIALCLLSCFLPLYVIIKKRDPKNDKTRTAFIICQAILIIITIILMIAIKK